MLRIPCPHCGVRDQPEFTYGGDAAPKRPDTSASVDDDGWVEYLFMRANPDGVHREYWHHTYGCRQWLQVTRSTRDNLISDVDFSRDRAAGEASA